MISMTLLWPLWSISPVAAKPLTTTDYQALDLTLPTAPSALLFTPDRPIRKVNTSMGNILNVQCDGARFGHNPNLVDCQSAKSYIYPDSEQRTWKERYTPGVIEGDFPLPFRGMGGEYTVFQCCKYANIADRSRVVLFPAHAQGWS